jgi:hypothetical protein
MGVIVERRDHRRRADAVRTLVERLARHDRGITIQELAATDNTLPPSAAERIVKRLAIQGLIHLRCAAAWAAAPPLLHPGALVVAEVHLNGC